ncbi:MAG: arsenite methyltransferase [Theionarchaea archaeon]|nr:arsenite methyltransferase [Theionarchaea archaeon]
MKENEIKKVVREGYAKVARRQTGSCCQERKQTAKVRSGCCGPSTAQKDKAERVEIETTCTTNVEEIGKMLGYSEEDLEDVPEGANLGLGCGNPVALASLQEGEIVLDLGSGAGFDCFLAAKKVGDTGKVIGVDMTPEMIDKARENAEESNYRNVEFRLGEIEHLPTGDNSVDVILSNCVINLSADKKSVFEEAYRVLKPGGRLMISDMVLLKELPKEIRNSVNAYVSCMGGAILKDGYIDLVKNAGFVDVVIEKETPAIIEQTEDDPAVRAIAEKFSVSPEKAVEVLQSIVSINVKGKKPA